MDPIWQKTDPHVAQQCRRERLRASHNVGEFLGRLDSASRSPRLNPESAESHCYQNIHLLLHQAAFSSETMNLARECNGSSSSVGLGGSFEARAGNASQMSLPRLSITSQIAMQNLDWVSYGSAGMMTNGSAEGHIPGSDLSANPEDLDCLDEAGGNFRKNDRTYHCGQSSLTNHSSEISSQDSPNCHGESNALVGFLLSATGSHGGSNGTSLALEKTKDTGHCSWHPEVAGNELALLPAYPEVHVNPGTRVDSSVWYGEASKSDHTTIGKEVVAGMNCGETRNTSLTLSSSPSIGMVIDMSGKGIQEVTGISSAAPCNSGPLGPFTGYASILKSSKFLKPAQLLLHEICGIPDTFTIQARCLLEGCSEDVGFGGASGIGSLSGSCSSGSLQPEYQQMKAKLLHMQVEVCKRYRQYHQQMHLVFSSFQTVAGLSSATPCISFALETILRNFDFLKNAILYQLRHLKKCFGEESPFPSIGPATNRGDPRRSKMKCINPSFPKHKHSTIGKERFDAQRVLRAQRGLPEHAVAILRAWLFEHFLHPYPTDADKHILARQTGLSRNQVSNWFINARVRVWKPMVEEIHILETKQQAEASQTPMGITTQGMECGLITNIDWNQVIRHGPNQYPYQSANEGSLMEFTPAPRGGVDFRELASASLALGLPRTAEFGQYPR
ncbi:hypothetical protein MLD38_008292 [Melastoma candidum]|uniref:Uncharacterized protein n=1 Tax=Melastoma candidum TaxID=119954 RepID=A0ACB9RV63_9MYRT|nr:hypothetical protein MLD38_008292 [Melastoma candidum]